MPLFNVALPMSIEAEDPDAAIDIFVTSLARHDQYAYTYRIEDAETGEVYFWIDGEALPASDDIVQLLLQQAVDADNDDEVEGDS